MGRPPGAAQGRPRPIRRGAADRVRQGGHGRRRGAHNRSGGDQLGRVSIASPAR